MFSIIEIILWLLGFAAAYFVHKKIDALCTENSVGAAEEYISQIKEENCGVKEALNSSKISLQRYENYVKIYNELKEKF